jgi:hypothetical protein
MGCFNFVVTLRVNDFIVINHCLSVLSVPSVAHQRPFQVKIQGYPSAASGCCTGACSHWTMKPDFGPGGRSNLETVMTGILSALPIAKFTPLMSNPGNHLGR